MGEQYVVRISSPAGEVIWEGRGIAAGFDVEQLTSLDRRRTDMDSLGVDRQILSVPPPFGFTYSLEPSTSSMICRALNDGLSAAAAADSDRFVAMATLPIHSMKEALTEMGRALDDLGMVGVSIGTHLGGRNLDDEALRPFFAVVEERQIPLFVHSTRALAKKRLSRYHLLNLIGNPTEDALAVASLIFGGVLEAHPGLRICIAHGGGSTAQLVGRWDRGWVTRAEAKRIPRPPSAYLSSLHFDSLTHSRHGLDHLIEVVGGEKLMMGTDYPYDMREPDPVSFVKSSIALSEEQVARVLGINAEMFFRI